MQAATLCLLLAIAAAAEEVTSQEDGPAILHSPQGCLKADRPLVITRATVDARAVDETSIRGTKDASTAKIKCINSDYELSTTGASAFCVNDKWTYDQSAKCVWKGYRLWRETDHFLMWAGIVAALMTMVYVIAMVTLHKTAARQAKGRARGRRNLDPADRHFFHESHFWHDRPDNQRREHYAPGGVASPPHRSSTDLSLASPSNFYYNLRSPSEDPGVYGQYRKSDAAPHNALYRD